MGDFNVRVGNFQIVETFEENVVEHCILRDSGLCHVRLWKTFDTFAKLHKLDYSKWYKGIPIDRCDHLFTVLACKKCG